MRLNHAPSASTTASGAIVSESSVKPRRSYRVEPPGWSRRSLAATAPPAPAPHCVGRDRPRACSAGRAIDAGSAASPSSRWAPRRCWSRGRAAFTSSTAVAAPCGDPGPGLHSNPHRQEPLVSRKGPFAALKSGKLQNFRVWRLYFSSSLNVDHALTASVSRGRSSCLDNWASALVIRALTRKLFSCSTASQRKSDDRLRMPAVLARASQSPRD
jgi:hypothetical protein